jgi:hypothetical protein
MDTRDCPKLVSSITSLRCALDFAGQDKYTVGDEREQMEKENRPNDVFIVSDLYIQWYVN